MQSKEFVYLLSVKRSDGKVEGDHLTSDVLLTKLDAEVMSKRVNAPVLLSLLGTLRYAKKSIADKNTFCVDCSAKIVENIKGDNDKKNEL